MAEKKECPKCKASMQEGFIPDFGNDGYVFRSAWSPGEPVQSSFMGIDHGIQMKGIKRYALTAYRCESCSFIEFYAANEI